MSPEMWTEPWYRALIEDARDDAGELGRIEQFLQASAKLPVGQREELVRLIGDYLRTANPGRPPRSESEALLWADAARCIHDTTAYDESATEHVLTFIGGPGWIRGSKHQSSPLDPPRDPLISAWRVGDHRPPSRCQLVPVAPATPPTTHGKAKAAE